MCYLRGYIKTDILWPTELVYANIYHFIINANKMAKLIRDMQKKSKTTKYKSRHLSI